MPACMLGMEGGRDTVVMAGGMDLVVMEGMQGGIVVVGAVIAGVGDVID